MVNLDGHTLSGSPALNITGVDGTTVRNGSVLGPVTADNATGTRFADVTFGSRFTSYDWTGTTSVTFLRSTITANRLFCGARCELRDSTFAVEQVYAEALVVRGDRGTTNNINFIGGTTTEIIGARLGAFRVGAAERLTIRDSAMDGFELFAPGRLDVQRSTFSGGPWVGVHTLGSGVVRDNRFEKMPNGGLRIDVQQPLKGRLLVERNVFADNRADGLHVEVPIPLDIVVRDNLSENNGQHGMWATPGTVRDGGGNISRDDALGCFSIACG
ncbi:right-handed parallel beta-helix repeat-containing protein [Lentzea sp. NPDC060358]|uniref:right-handed parallel beta-helix repeat-containing protein n=1 Tax=Lentzea sp. NPDC060358 TaxID=3347103 RepID=UPI003660625A